MTVDFQVAFPCPHLTVEERVELGTDRRTLRLRQPVNSGAFTQITANNDLSLVIPPSGLESQARVVSSQAGPFRICKGQEDCTVSNAQGSVALTLPVGNRVPAETIMQRFQRAFQESGYQLQAVVNNGYLTLSDTSTKGVASRVRISGGALESLGFEHNTAARGREVFPGWNYVERPETYSLPGLKSFLDVTAREIRFTEPVRSNPILKVTYTTVQQRCLRCQSLAVENDFRFDVQGEPRMVGNEDLLQQRLGKIMFTLKGSNPFHPRYGANLRVGVKNLGGLTIREDVEAAASYLMQIQDFQGRSQELTARERIAAITAVTVVPAEDDPTRIDIYLEARNASGRPVNITTTYTAPGVAALAGTNGVSLGLAPRGLASDTTARDIFG